MEKQEFKSKWDELARELGAEILPETIEREQAVVTTSQDADVPTARPAAKASAADRSPVPKRPAADWDSLAGELGLPPSEPAAPMMEEAPPQPPREKVIRPRESGPAKTERPQRERRERREPAGKRHEQHREQREKPQHRRERPERQREQPARHREQREVGGDRPAESEREVATNIEATPTSSTSPHEEPARGAAVSLWHKIFGSPAQQTAKLTDKPSPELDEGTETTDERGETNERHAQPIAATSEEMRSLSGDLAAAEIIEEDVFNRDDVAVRSTDESIPEERQRGRRRRRGGRGRKSAERPAKASRAAEVGDEDELDELADSEMEEDLSAAEGGPTLEEDLADGEDDAEDATGSSRSKAAQRAIPTWDEAIGFIVDSNMQNRSQRRPPSRSGSRGNSSRGRSRGRTKN